MLPCVIINTILLTYKYLVLQYVSYHFVMPSFKFTKYVCTLTSHARFNYTSQLAGRLYSFQIAFLVRFTKVHSVVSNCSLKRLHQSTTIYLFFLAFISVTSFCFSLPKTIIPQHFVVSAAHMSWFCSKEWFICNYREQDQHIGKWKCRRSSIKCLSKILCLLDYLYTPLTKRRRIHIKKKKCVDCTNIIAWDSLNLSSRKFSKFGVQV